MGIDEMDKKKVKILIWLGLCAGGFVLAFSSFPALGEFLARFQQGADPASALNLPPPLPVDRQMALTWLVDEGDTGRPFPPFTRRQLERDYLRAWEQFNWALAAEDPTGLGSYFAGPGLAAVEETVAAAAGESYRLEQVQEGHILKLHLFSADGSIVSFTAVGVEIRQTIRDERGAVLATPAWTADFEVVMFLEDGNWRVRHWVMRPHEPGG